jgi:hypothetical protein
MPVTLELDSKVVNIYALESTPLPEISFAISSGMAWMMGQGVYMVTGNVFNEKNRALSINIRALVTPKPLMHSTHSTVAGLVETGYLPRALHVKETISPGESVIRAHDGNNRVGSNREGTFINTGDLRPDVSLGDLAFGVADQFVGQFCQGAKAVEWRGSLKLCQVWFNIGMTPTELGEYATRPYCYQPDWTAQTIIDKIK